MKKIYTSRKRVKVAVPQHRYWRRWFSPIVSRLTKRQSDSGLNIKLDVMIDILKDMGESIDLMAREMARQAKRNSRNGTR